MYKDITKVLVFGRALKILFQQRNILIGIHFHERELNDVNLFYMKGMLIHLRDL